MRNRSARGGWYDHPSPEEAIRYSRYFHARYWPDKDNWYWTYWDTPTGDALKFRIGEDYRRWHHANTFGTPFAHQEENFDTEIYDRYYKRRFPWRKWNSGSARCLAARNGCRCEETEE